MSLLGGPVQLPTGFLGLPSLHSIIEAIAGGFFGALASALVPSWLKHGTVSTIQQLVALPDPASWSHVAALQGEMTYLGAMLAPVTLAVGALRYWAVGLTGSAHPASAVTRCAGATAGLVAYRWGVEQVVAATNTLTHGILGLPSVAAGLQRIIGVLFGGALLSGTGGVFGAFLVIIGVVFAAGLFAAQVLLTVVLALLIVSGPPLIAIAAIPELAHLAHAWRDALLAVALIPLGWTVLFATAGALCLDATSFTGGAGGLPGHVAAAFAGLITFALAVKLPFLLLGELRGILSRSAVRSHSAGGSSSVAGADRVKSARARLRTVALDAVPALGASVGRAAGALGAPAGGPIGVARRSLRHTLGHDQRPAVPQAGTQRNVTDRRGGKRSARERLREAGAILAAAPGEALLRTRKATPRPYPSDRGHPEGRARQVRADASTHARAAPGQQTAGADNATYTGTGASRIGSSTETTGQARRAPRAQRTVPAHAKPARLDSAPGSASTKATAPPRHPEMHEVPRGERAAPTAPQPGEAMTARERATPAEQDKHGEPQRPQRAAKPPRGAHAPRPRKDPPTR